MIYTIYTFTATALSDALRVDGYIMVHSQTQCESSQHRSRSLGFLSRSCEADTAGSKIQNVTNKPNILLKRKRGILENPATL